MGWTKATVFFSESVIQEDILISIQSAVVAVRSTSDVSATLEQIRKHQLPFTVRGGGHSTSGSASIDNGLVVDLSKMRGVTVDPEARTITAEGGTIWEDVDVAAAKHGLATVGGTVNHTGVGGLTLGGGYGYLTGKYGLTIDNLLAVEVVLASGEVVTASKTSHPDLFWAIRGAGQNFGVVTKFTFQGYEQKNPVFAGPLVFPPTALPQIVQFMNKFHETNDGNQALVVAFSSPPPQNAPVILTQLFHNGTEEESKEIFADLFALQPLANMSGMVPYQVLNSLLNVSAGFDGRKLFGGGAFKLPLDPGFMEGVYKEFQAFVESKKEHNVAQSMVLWEVVPYKKVIEVKNEETSFANRGDYYNVATMFKWYVDPPFRTLGSLLTVLRRFDASLDTEMRAFSRSLLKRASETAANRSKDGGVGQYGNYSSEDVEANEIFGENVRRLEDLKQKYDPENLFSHGTKLTPRPLVVVN